MAVAEATAEMADMVDRVARAARRAMARLAARRSVGGWLVSVGWGRVHARKPAS